MNFPEGFVWGAATASAQIEGAADADGRTPSIWDTFTDRPGVDSPRVACDHYHRWRDDLGIMRELGLGAYRFSISWSRIVPAADGRVEQRGLDFYDRLVDGLLEAGIDPFLTLYHWDLPQWLQDQGGWAARATVDRFAEFTGIMSDRLGDRVRHWSTQNEPWVFVFLAHLDGEHAPGVRDERTAVAAMHHALLAHGRSVRVLREKLPADRKIGIALSMTPAEPATEAPADVAAADRYSLYRNWLFLHPILRGEYHPGTGELFSGQPPIEDGDLAEIAQPIDFVGINYYARGVVSHDDSVPASRARLEQPPGRYTSMGWEVHAPGLESILRQTHERYPGPDLFVTENGSAWDDEVPTEDPRRCEYLLEHLEAASRAIEGGVPLKGYFAWSLLDNFEWAEGYAKRFGLVHVDYETQRRTIKQSGRLYRDVITGRR